jgi:hypothetical protein
MADVNIIKIDGKPLEKLIETVSAGIGVIYKPRAIRKEADAKNYEIQKIAEARAKASIIKSDTEGEIAERARQRLYFLEMQRQVNIDNVVDLATDYLDETVSDRPVDEDWRTRFFDKAQDVTSKELQTIWAKILANEINKPGDVSLRTLNILSTLSKDEALKLSNFLKLTTQNGEVIKFGNHDLTKYGVTFDDLMLLRETGLVDHSNVLKIEYTTTLFTTDKERMAVVLTLKNRGLIVSRKNLLKFSFDIYSLTNSGKELSKIIKTNQSDVYFEDLRDILIKGGYSVQETRLAYKVIEGN